ncbi:MAG: molecular chaperone DnaK [bacterium]|nr:molecular chaperone DnaK [bacterium]
MGKVIGIDLGTTNSVAAYMEGKVPEIILSPEGDRLMPSLVAFSKDGDRLVGNPAKSQLITNPNTLYSVKRLMGKRFSEVAPYLEQFNYQIVEDKQDMLKIRIDGDLFSPEEISAMLLEKLKDSAESRLHDTVDGVIITVPAYFNDSQRQATQDAGEIAGLNVLRIINEPTAASLAFSIEMTGKANILVYDFGGGTIDISVLEVSDEIIKVLATAGDINLGGNDFDIILAEKVAGEMKDQHNIDISIDKMAMQRIRDAVENLKKELSHMEESEINLPFIATVEGEPIHFARYITRMEFEKLIEERVERTIEICISALRNAELTVDEIDEILLVGGTTRIPCIQKRIKKFFKKEPNKKINPDEIVAMGAAIQASIASGLTKDVLLLDVIPISLGVKTFGGAFTRIIEANTTVPTNRSLVFSTVEDNQEEVEVNVFQGEREIAEENKLLGKFTLTGIGKAPKGMPRIEVKFTIDINGILKVTAIDLSTNNKKEVIVSNSGLLSRDDIGNIKKSAKKFKQSDIKKKELIRLKNEIINYVYMIKRGNENPNLDPTLSAEAERLIKEAYVIIQKENPTNLEELHQQLADFDTKINQSEDRGISAVITPAPLDDLTSAPSKEINTVFKAGDTGPEAFAVPEMPDEFKPYETPAGTETDNMYKVPGAVKITQKRPHEPEFDDLPLCEPPTAEVPPVFKVGNSDQTDTKTASPKKLKTQNLQLKKKILGLIYNIEQYVGNLQLEALLISECTLLIRRANEAMDSEDFDHLKTVYGQLEELNKRLDRVVGVSLGLLDSDVDDAGPQDAVSNNSKPDDDTKPFKIFKG